MRDPYRVLGVPPDAEPAELRRAYRAAVRRWHPDHNHAPEAVARFSEILRAWEVLGDPSRRAAYEAARPSANVVFVRRRPVLTRLWRRLRGRPSRFPAPSPK